MAQFRLSLAVVVAALLSSSCSTERSIPVHTYAMGDRITLGHIVYVVYETQWLTHLGEGPDARVPQNRFFLVRLSAVNSFGSDVIVPNFTLEDDNRNSFAELSAGEGVPQYIGYLRTVKPAESQQGNALFDVPPRHYKMKIADETGEKIAYVDIPLSFVSETIDAPPLPEKEMEKGKGKDKKK
jgi:hypothetical protein